MLGPPISLLVVGLSELTQLPLAMLILLKNSQFTTIIAHPVTGRTTTMPKMANFTQIWFQTLMPQPLIQMTAWIGIHMFITCHSGLQRLPVLVITLLAIQ